MIRDARTAPFIWASIAALDHLRSEWGKGDHRVSEAVGRSVYYALCELANEDRARSHVNEDSGRFKTSRGRICAQAGVSDKPVDRALRELERIGLLHVERAESEGSRPGSASWYMLLEPDQTCGLTPETSGPSPHVDGDGPTDALRTSYGPSPQVDGKGAEEVRTSPYRVKKTEKKEEVCVADTHTSAAPEIRDPLARVAGSKHAPIDDAELLRICRRYSDRDLVDEAERFAAWHLVGGNGENAPAKPLARKFGEWLRRAPSSRAASTPAPADSPVGAIEETEKAKAAWAEGKRLLEEQLRLGTFIAHIAPLEVVGERGGRLVLVDSSGRGMGKFYINKARTLVLEAVAGFDDLEVVDETQLELEAR